MLNLAICSIILFGPIDAPTRQPVIANLLENVYKIMVLSFIPGMLTIDSGGSSVYLIS